MTATITREAAPAIDLYVPTAKLRDALRAVLPAASKDKTLPILNAVQVRLSATGVTFLATDRYLLAEYTISGHDVELRADRDESAPDEVAVTISGDEVKALISSLPTRAPEWDKAALALTEGGDFETPTLEVSLFSGARFTYRGAEGEFPPVRRLFPDNNDPKFDGMVGLGVKQMTQALNMTKHLDKNATITLHGGGETHKPVLFRVEGVDEFRGIIMPRRVA